MTATAGPTQVWQARIDNELADQLLDDGAVLGLNGRSEVVRAGLDMLHRRAAEERMAQDVDAFYGDGQPPLPVGVHPADD